MIIQKTEGVAKRIEIENDEFQNLKNTFSPFDKETLVAAFGISSDLRI